VAVPPSARQVEPVSSSGPAEQAKGRVGAQGIGRPGAGAHNSFAIAKRSDAGRHGGDHQHVGVVAAGGNTGREHRGAEPRCVRSLARPSKAVFQLRSGAAGPELHRRARLEPKTQGGAEGGRTFRRIQHAEPA